MKTRKSQGLDFIVDRLTNSITNRITGDSFLTEITMLSESDLKSLSVRKGWLFNWKREFSEIEKEVYKLTIFHNPTIIQGLLSLSIKSDHVFMNLIESAKFNRGDERMYEGVAGNLVAFACRLSFQRGFEGFVAFHAKSQLIEHYSKTLKAKHFGNLLMVIDTIAASELVERYFRN